MFPSRIIFTLVFFQTLVVYGALGEKTCENVDCDSWNFKYKSCDLNNGGISSMSVIHKRSVSKCEKGVSYGIGEHKRSVWVDKGCRATFKICRRDETIICEHATESISCAEGKIKIKYASYGRHDETTCPDPRIITTDCHAENSLSIVSELCNGKSSCSLTASNSVFGDPCVNTYKYLSVEYKCEKKGCGGNFYAPHESDCTKFYQCDEYGGVFEKQCPHGLHWNKKYNTCDWPRNVECKNPSGCGGNFYAPHESDCTKFYQCDEYGGVFQQECPDGLKWNKKQNICDWPGNVTC